MKIKSSAFTTQRQANQCKPLYLLEIDASFIGITGKTSTASNIYLDAHASPNDDAYNEHTITITNIITGATESKTILDYVGSTRLITVSSGFSISTQGKKYKLSNTYRYTNWSKNLTYSGIMYNSRVIRVASITENSMGEIDAPEIVIDDTDKQLTFDTNIYNFFRNNELRLMTAFYNISSFDPTNYLLDIFTIRTCSFDTGVVGISAEHAIARQIDTLPERIWFRESCPWIYRDTATCNYQGSAVQGLNGEDDYCSKTFHGNYGCKFGKRVDGTNRLNTLNFGGAPTIPSKKAIIFVPSGF